MGNVQTKSTLANGIATAKRNPTETAFFAWLTYSILHQWKISRKRSNQVEIVNVHKGDGKKMTFTQTDGGEVDMGWTGALEYFLGSGIRLVQTYGMFKLGEKFFKGGANRMTEYHRVRNLLWGAFTFVPMFDLIFSDWTNPKKEDQGKHYDVKFRLPLYLWVIAELASTWKVIKVICDAKSSLAPREKIAMLVSLMFFNGAMGITISHELVHKHWWVEKLLGYALLTNVNYNHWMEEHVTGHHSNVATPEDPASSRLNESLYAFLPRTFIGSWRSAWNIEQKRIKDNQLHPILNNRMIANALLPLLWGGFIAKTTGGGMRALKLFYIQAFGAAMLLEVVNYVEHYGLSREKLSDGRYERPNPSHSWNSPHRLSNSILFKLQRHSDHHTYASRPYQLLRNFSESPQLPSGYPGMVVLALFPPIYRWIMNPLVKAAKVKPENYQEEYFQKDKEWLAAEKVAQRKMALFSTTLFSISTYGLYLSEKARTANKV